MVCRMCIAQNAIAMGTVRTCDLLWVFSYTRKYTKYESTYLSRILSIRIGRQAGRTKSRHQICSSSMHGVVAPLLRALVRRTCLPRVSRHVSPRHCPSVQAACEARRRGHVRKARHELVKRRALLKSHPSSIHY